MFFFDLCGLYISMRPIESQDLELQLFLDALPLAVRERVSRAPDLGELVEVVLDYGRPAEIRFMRRYERMEEYLVGEDDIRYVCERVSEFGGDNRAGIERTLHRISAIRNRQGRIIGLTCRFGRALFGTIDIIQDIVESGKSILLLGKPGVGKTTKLREVARLLSEDLGKRVVIVDTSNEIGGDGDIPHPAIGRARRMPVSDPSKQHQVMIEAVENHMPEVIVIDEIGTEAEAYAARTIAERGVQLIGTAHGGTLENLMMNPTLCDLVGGIQAVTLSDEEARRRGTQKTVLERKAPPTFEVVIELLDYDRLAVHHDVQSTVDAILRGGIPRPEIRVRTPAGKVEVVQKEVPASGAQEPARVFAVEDFAKEEQPKVFPPRQRVWRIFPYGIARTRLERAIRERRMPAVISHDVSDADVVLAIKSSLHKRPERLREPLGRQIPIYVIKSNTLSQIVSALEDILSGGATGEEDEARQEALEGVEYVRLKGRPLELSPRPFHLRRIQHQVARAHRLRSESVGEDPHRRVRILPVSL